MTRSLHLMRVSRPVGHLSRPSPRSEGTAQDLTSTQARPIGKGRAKAVITRQHNLARCALTKRDPLTTASGNINLGYTGL